MANRLTVYFTSDTHGFLFPTNFVDRETRPVGLLCMSFPKDGNTLIIDGGDTLQGSPLTYYCHREGLPMPCAAAMNGLGYDYVTLGNHDFNYGYETIRDYLTELDARCLCANVSDTTGTLPVGSHTVRVMENGLRVGLVGLVTPWINRWEKPENLERFRIGDPLAAARETVAALREQVDFLIGIYHGGVEKDLDTGRLLSRTDENIACRLCEELPFDLLLTGHQHIAMANRTWHGTHVVQTPCNAAAYIRVEVDTEGVIRSALCKPEGPARFLPGQLALLESLNGWLDRPIGRLSRALRPEAKLTMALHGSPIADFFNLVQMDASGAELSCTSLGNELRGFEQTVTVRDVVASYVYANTLAVLSVTGRVLRDALEQCARYFSVDETGAVGIAEPFRKPKEAHYNYDYFAGVNYTFDLRNPPGRRVTRLERDGRAVMRDDRFQLVMNNYRATGAGDFDCFIDCPHVRDMQTEVSELILDFLAEHEVIRVPDDPAYEVILPDGERA